MTLIDFEIETTLSPSAQAQRTAMANMLGVAAFANQEWRVDSACNNLTADEAVIFFPRRGAAGMYDAAEAKKICATCPVAADCLNHAIVYGEDHGVWGGYTTEEIQAHRRQVKKTLREGGSYDSVA